MWLDRKHAFLVLLICGVALSATVVSAELSTTSETTYAGGEASNDQAITVTYTFSPEGSRISDVIVDFDSGKQTFIQGGSFSYTVQPGAAGVNVTNVRKGEFRVDELGANEEITFTFKIYPKNIKQESLQAGQVQVEYVQNGQELSHEETIDANISSSPWFQLQEKQAQLENEQTSQTVSLGVFAGAIVFGIVGIGLAGVFYRRLDARAASERAEFVKDLQQKKNQISSASAKRRIQDLIDKYGADSGTGPTPTPGEPPSGSDDDGGDDDGDIEPPSV